MVNKMRPFAQIDWEPNDLVDFEGQQLRAEAARAARTMMDAAKAEGVTLTVSSAYRSYAVHQQTLSALGFRSTAGGWRIGFQPVPVIPGTRRALPSIFFPGVAVWSVTAIRWLVSGW